MEGPYSARFYWIPAGGLRMGRPFAHRPVLAHEVTRLLAVAEGGVIVDATLGGGGHAEALLDTLDESTRVIGIDKDPAAIKAASERLKRYGERARMVHGDFRDIASIITDTTGIESINSTSQGGPVAAVLLDLGVSSPQLDVAERGFSFAKDGPLDMRMNPDAPFSAADIVNEYSESDLAAVLHRYGDERFARRIARAVCARRTRKPFESTADLADVVRDAIPAATRRSGRHPARRSFQALRIEVNDELGALDAALEGAAGMLAPGGRLAVISYHSLEDRRVKTFFRESAGREAPRGMPLTDDQNEANRREITPGSQPILQTVTTRPVRPGANELEENPRSESARLRVAERMEAAT